MRGLLREYRSGGEVKAGVDGKGGSNVALWPFRKAP